MIGAGRLAEHVAGARLRHPRPGAPAGARAAEPSFPRGDETAAVPRVVERGLALREQGRTPVLVGAYATCALIVVLCGSKNLTLTLSQVAVLPLLCIVLVSRTWWTGYVVAAALTLGVGLAYHALPAGLLPTPGAVAWYIALRLGTYGVLVLLVQALLCTALTLQQCLRALAAERAAAWRLATTDPLTGLANRRRFDAHLAAEIARCAQHDRPLAVLLLDIDRFKEINDTRGHAAGDAALARVGTVLRAAIGVSALAARIGGDEFAVVVPAMEQDHVDQIARAVAARLLVEDEEPLCVSIGVAHLGSLASQDLAGSAPAAALLLAQADRALYQAKQRGQRRQDRGALAVLKA